MRRLALLALALLLLTACGRPAGMPTDEAYHPGTDHPYPMQSNHSSFFTLFVETEKGYYFRVPDMLFYMDADTMEPLPVCSKPNCLHYEENDRQVFRTCDAYLPCSVFPTYTGMYDGSLYMWTKDIGVGEDGWNKTIDVILRVSPDGTRRETLWTLGYSGTGMDVGLIFHRGTMYRATETRDESGTKHVVLAAYSLADPGREAEVLYEAEYTGWQSSIYNLTAYGNRLYFTRPMPDSDYAELCVLDLRTGELTVPELPDPDFDPLFVTFCGGKLLLECLDKLPPGTREEAYRTDRTERLYRGELDGSGWELLGETRIGCFSADERYIYKVPEFYSGGEKDPYVHIWDADMNELDRIDLTELADPAQYSMACCMSGSGDQAFLGLWLREDTGPAYRYYWFSKSDIGSGNIELHRFFDNDGDEYSAARVDRESMR